MEFNDYQKAAKRTRYGNEQVLTNCALGLAGEAGQVVDLVKNYTFKGHPLDKDQLTHELGDVLWYLSQIAVTQTALINRPRVGSPTLCTVP